MESRDFVYIDDVVAITARAVEYKKQLVDVFNVGVGVPTCVLTIANTLQQLIGQNVSTTVSGQFRLGDIRHNYADLAKIQKVLGFIPSVFIEQGLDKFVDWVKTEPIRVDRYDQSLEELKSKGLFK
jgi:dTDP-L-rhamnose 4-epimerase